MMGSFIIYTVHQIKKGEVGGARSTNVEVRSDNKLFSKTLKGGDHLVDVGVDGNTILNLS
jgi:hypothetical protein